VYKILKAEPDEGLIESLAEQGCDAVIFTSKSTVDNFITIFGEARAKAILKNALLVAIGPVTAVALKNYGIKNYIIAGTHTIDGIVATIKEHFAK
jgi:uroporphyrinogen III methyltransferase/synthase